MGILSSENAQLIWMGILYLISGPIQHVGVAKNGVVFMIIYHYLPCGNTVISTRLDI
jgi:hypothetical protein